MVPRNRCRSINSDKPVYSSTRKYHQHAHCQELRVRRREATLHDWALISVLSLLPPLFDTETINDQVERRLSRLETRRESPAGDDINLSIIL